MSKKISTLIFLLSLVLPFSGKGQSLLDMLNDENALKSDTNFTEATFKSTRLINGQTVETVGRKQMNFIISHRFGNLSLGAYDFWGLDQSFIRMGLEYGLTNRVDVGVGRSNEQKLADGYIKVKILRQSSGAVVMPVTVCWYSSMSYTHQRWPNPNRDNLVSSRFYYVHQAIVARKFTEKFSAQISPGVVHRNLVQRRIDQNDVPYVGIGGRYKLSNRFSFNCEYVWIFPGQTAKDYINPLAFGFDIETGGHVFQLHLSNARGRTEKGIPENSNDWLKGEFGFGFNIIRHFNVGRK